MENLNISNENQETEDTLESEESIFDVLIKGEIIDVFINDFEDAGFEKEEIDEFLTKLKSLDEDSIKRVLSMPDELRKRNFPLFKQKIEDGEMQVSEIVDRLLEIGLKNGFSLGYHISKYDIQKEGDKWEIKATELDDRDDRKMAYYSLDYKNLYRADRGTKLYVVRAETGDNSTHKRDTKNNWGRANSISIICKIDLASIGEEIEKRLKQEKGVA